MAETAAPAKAPETPEAGTIEAALTYTVDTGETLVNETRGALYRQVTGTFEDHIVAIRDGRALRDRFTLDGNGFEFVGHDTAMADFFDPEQIRSVYYPEIEQLVRDRTGAARVLVFDHTLRSGSQATREERLIREPVKSVHNDYTEWSGPQRVRDLLPDEADALLKRRFAIVQVWRAIRNPIESDPLAICDAASLETKDLILCERRYPDRIGQTYRVAFNPAHRWFWFPRMARDEALVFKVFDTARDGRARFTAHSAFADPASPPDAAPRESIEMRTIAFFDE